MKTGLAIYDILVNDAGIDALVDERIYPNVVRRRASHSGDLFPFIIYDISGDSPGDTKDGVSTLDSVSVMVSGYSKTYNEASDLAAAIRTALDRVSGTYNTIVIQSIQFEGYDDLFDDDSGDEGIYRKALNFKVDKQ